MIKRKIYQKKQLIVTYIGNKNAIVIRMSDYSHGFGEHLQKKKLNIFVQLFLLLFLNKPNV